LWTDPLRHVMVDGFQFLHDFRLPITRLHTKFEQNLSIRGGVIAT